MNEAILLVDDEPALLSAYKRHLGSHYTVETACSGDEGLRRLAEAGPFAVVVSDFKMPGMDGIAFLRRVKEAYPDTARILLTGYGDMDVAVDAVNEGGVQHFLTKPTPAAVLCRYIDDSAHSHQRQVELRETVKRLNGEQLHTRAQRSRSSRFDPVTGLMSRKALGIALAPWAEDLISRHSAGTIVTVDIDRFAKLNAGFGEKAGDHVLSTTADRLAGVVEDRSIVGRWDSGSLLFTMNFGESEELVGIFLEQVREMLSQDVVYDGESIPIGVSIGAVCLQPGDIDPARATALAELALSWAKGVSPGGVRVETPLDTSPTGRISTALRRGEFELRFQPQVELATGRVIGAEALLRRIHPVYGIQTPNEFLADARDENMLVPIGAWAVGEACRALARWQDHAPGLSLAVNVTAGHVSTPGFVDTIKEAIADTGIDPALLELEITERERLSRTCGAQEAMQTLRAFGVKLAIDDFGTEYATIGNLVDFSFDKMKVDKEFVGRLCQDGKVEGILAWIAGLSQASGLRLVAEGVETKEQLTLLRDMGYDYAQGYLFAAALTESDFLDWVRARA